MVVRVLPGVGHLLASKVEIITTATIVLVVKMVIDTTKLMVAIIIMVPLVIITNLEGIAIPMDREKPCPMIFVIVAKNPTTSQKVVGRPTKKTEANLGQTTFKNQNLLIEERWDELINCSNSKTSLMTYLMNMYLMVIIMRIIANIMAMT